MGLCLTVSAFPTTPPREGKTPSSTTAQMLGLPVPLRAPNCHCCSMEGALLRRMPNSAPVHTTGPARVPQHPRLPPATLLCGGKTPSSAQAAVLGLPTLAPYHCHCTEDDHCVPSWLRLLRRAIDPACSSSVLTHKTTTLTLTQPAALSYQCHLLDQALL